jgi:flagellar L-ring protein precursor FlgH
LICAKAHYQSRIRPLLLLGTLGLIVGCSSMEPKLTPVDRDVFRSHPIPRTAVPAHSEGSLFAGESRRSLLFVDPKARLINDVLTIRIVESASASGEATTGTGRESSLSARIESFFGVHPEIATKAGMSNNFDGSGTTSRKNSLTATLTAVVREVFPNGNLYIEGKKEVIINNERQYIIVTGIVRPEDIQSDNSIASNLIADARIEYSGRGVIAEKQRPGWLGRVLDVVWPF